MDLPAGRRTYAFALPASVLERAAKAGEDLRLTAEWFTATRDLLTKEVPPPSGVVGRQTKQIHSPPVLVWGMAGRGKYALCWFFLQFFKSSMSLFGREGAFSQSLSEIFC